MKDDALWLNRWKTELQGPAGQHVLELGCGDGQDSLVINTLAMSLTSTDIRAEAIKKNRLDSNIDFRILDMKQPFEFENAKFTCVVASLCLHYFTLTTTALIISEITRVLTTDGLLIGRVNSINDKAWGAIGHSKIETGLFDVNGQSKRFFDKSGINTLLEPNWRITSLAERTIDRYEKPKVVWEFSAKKT